MNIFIDFETFWDKDYTLSKMGPIEYIRDPRFTPQCIGVRIDKGPTHVVDEEKLPELFLKLKPLMEDHRNAVIGHNISGFDGLILSEYYGIHPAHIYDTMVMARWVGVSRLVGDSHKAVTDFLTGEEKKPGTVVSCGKQHKNDFTPEEWQYFRGYCSDDVRQCADNFYLLLPYMTPVAMRFMDMTARMATNAYMVLDRGMLEQYITELDDRAEKSRQELSQLFGFSSREEFLQNIRSAVKFTEMLRRLGTEPPMKYSEAKSATKKRQMETAGLDTSDPESWAVYSPALAKSDLDFQAMTEDPDDRVALLVRTRLEHNSSIDRSRAVRFLSLANGKPMPAMLKCFFAHTARYGAGNSEGATDGVQLQNLPKRNQSQLLLRKSIKATAGYKFVACDSSQIEARMLAYIAGETELVEQFREGRDPYSELAEKIFSIPWQDIKKGAKTGNKKYKMYRNIGKKAILSAGYGVSARKYSDTLLREGTKLSDNLDEHYELAKHAHTVYRLSNPNIVMFWNICQRVIEGILEGASGTFGGPDGTSFAYGMEKLYGRDVPTVRLVGPDYALRYPGLRAEQGEKKVEYWYDRPRGYGKLVPTRIYGGALTENVIQSLAFQLLMWQATEMDKAGLPVVSNIHDSFLVCVPEADAEATKAKMEQIMSTVPPWLPGFPVACEAEIGEDYTIA